ncbi:uncharacterized protein [Eschrichtius robustus]|uniref:uncharacterized protein isoform X2 n=1 Tax=Eschrichtius robustus TaxID=9764 RepID=UPI0035C046BC
MLRAQLVKHRELQQGTYRQEASWSLSLSLPDAYTPSTLKFQPPKLRESPLGNTLLLPFTGQSDQHRLWSPRKLWWDAGGIWEKAPRNSPARVAQDPNSFHLSDAAFFSQGQSQAVIDSLGISKSLIPRLKDDCLLL